MVLASRTLDKIMVVLIQKMTDKLIQCAIMFADVVDSVRLFERYGDVLAKRYITACLDLIRKISDNHQGVFIKAMGDGIMYRFTEADNAIKAACEIQETQEIVNTTVMTSEKPALFVRIGLHYGLVILDKNDIFGDAVNVAARISAIAKEGQVVTTEQMVHNLSDHLTSLCRQFDRAKIKGKREELNLYTILWATRDVTCLAPPSIRKLVNFTCLTLRYRDEQRKITIECTGFLIGRDDDCDFVIKDDLLISRRHARIQHQNGKFVLADNNSTNGTWIKTEDGRTTHLYRGEDLYLWGRGVISLGKPIYPDEEDDLIFFVCS